MRFTDLFIRRPVVATVVNLIILIAGYTAWKTLSVRQYPRSDISVITVKTGKSNTYGSEVAIRGESRVVYRPEKPLGCGAQVWIETQAEVVIDGAVRLP